jgi:CheY-like chemotaxis protein
MAAILLIDDSKVFRLVTAKILRVAGHTVDTAEDGKAGLELYRSGVYDLIVTDLVMPEMNGLALIAGLRHTEHPPRIIAMSGDSGLSQSDLLPEAKQLGAQRILLKPVSPSVLMETVADVLAEPAPRPEAHAQPAQGAGPGDGAPPGAPATSEASP